MNARGALALAVVALFVAAVAVAVLTRTSGGIVRVAGTSSSATDAHGAEDEVQQDFALLHLAVSETPEPFVPLVFLLRITPRSGGAVTRRVPASREGTALYGPLENETSVAVSVVAGGASFGFDEERVLGTTSFDVPRTGGRLPVVVPVTPCAIAGAGHRVVVLDGDGWPVDGARVRGAGVSLVTSADGYGASRVTGRVEVVCSPPAHRPDLEEVTAMLEGANASSIVTLSKRRVRDVSLLAWVRPLGGVERVTIRPLDGRARLEQFDVASDGMIRGVPLGRYRVTFRAAGTQYEAVLEAAAESVALRPLAPVPLAQVEAVGAWGQVLDSGADTLALVERSEVSCLLSLHVTGSTEFELAQGRGVTSLQLLAAIDEESGCATFEGVPHGAYELVAPALPQAVSHLVFVGSGGGAVRFEAHARKRTCTVRGTLTGVRSRMPFAVELKCGEMLSPTRTVDVGETFRFDHLEPGLYSIRAVRTDIDARVLQGAPVVATPWRNVAVKAGEETRVDFEVR